MPRFFLATSAAARRALAISAAVVLLNAGPASSHALGARRQTLLRRSALRAAQQAQTAEPFAAAAAALDRVDDGEGGSLRPKPELVIPGDTLETLPSHVAWTATCSAAVAILALRALALAPLPGTFTLLSALVLGDALSAVIHWGTDNYGSIRTPVVGSVCAAFQGHHKAPWTITHRSFWNNVFKIAKTALPAVALAALTLPPLGAAFVATLLYSQLLAQELHRWSHCLPSELAPWQRWLQDSGLVLSRAEHLRHHTPPFDRHYAILLGATNGPLDRAGVFRVLERWVLARTGNEANCWNEPKGGAAVRARAMQQGGGSK